ncbi:MAG: ferredoxin [Pseudomonadota bacterium]
MSEDIPNIQAALDPHFLEVLGGFAVDEDEAGFPAGTRTLLLIGPKEPGFWAHVQAQPEWSGPHPLDRWSRRVIGRVACDLGAKALFPFGGPPYQPFYSWALRTGRVWDSPVKLLVHATQGLMVSFRGALALPRALTLPAPAVQPCATCAKPCLTACPASALTGAGYDVPRCHAHLDQPDGADCLSGGCLVRSPCPAGAGYARMPSQSAYHMRQFHP